MPTAYPIPSAYFRLSQLCVGHSLTCIYWTQSNAWSSLMGLAAGSFYECWRLAFLVQLSWSVASSKSPNETCVRPQLDLWNERLAQLFAAPPPLTCKDVPTNWVHVSNRAFQISNEAVRSHGPISCDYLPIYRGKDEFEVIIDFSSSCVYVLLYFSCGSCCVLYCDACRAVKLFDWVCPERDDTRHFKLGLLNCLQTIHVTCTCHHPSFNTAVYKC